MELAYSTPDTLGGPRPANVDGVGRLALRDNIDASPLRQIPSIFPFDWFGKVKPHTAPICERPRG